MGYEVLWADPHFPRIIEADHGIALADALSQVVRHHVGAILSHVTAIQRCVDDALS